LDVHFGQGEFEGLFPANAEVSSNLRRILTELVFMIFSFIVHPIRCPSIRSNLTRSRTLKRQSVALLRQGAGIGRKILWVWDKAGVDLPFWQERKVAGIYFLSLRKEGMCLEAVRHQT
jgi:hypothetical protein